MANVFARKCLRVVVATLCQTIGWRKIKPTSMEVLIDLLERYITSLGKGAHEYAEQRGSTVPVLEDLALALSDAGVTIPPLEEYIHEVGQIPWPENSGIASSGAVPVFPVQVPSRRNGVDQHLQFFDSWAESEDECCSYMVPPTQHTNSDSNVGVYPSEVSVDVIAGGSCKTEEISRSTDSMPPSSQASVVAMTECGILSASRDGRQPSARRPTTPPRYSPSPDRQYVVGGFHPKKEKKKIKGKENTGVSKPRIKTVLGMGKARPPPECSSGQSIDSAFTTRFCDKTQPFNSQKYSKSKGNLLNSVTSKDVLQHSQHAEKKSLSLAPSKDRNSKSLHSPGSKHVTADNTLTFKHSFQAIPGAASNKDSSDFHSDSTDCQLPQCKKLEDKPKSEPVDCLEWREVPIKTEPVDVNSVISDNASSNLNSNNLMSQKPQIKTEITIDTKEEKRSLDDQSFLCTSKENVKSLLVTVPQSVQTVNRSEPVDHQRISSKSVGGNFGETRSSADPTERKQPKIITATDTVAMPSLTDKSNSSVKTMDLKVNKKNKTISKERSSHLPVSVEKSRERQDKKTETPMPSKKLLNPSAKLSTKEANTNSAGYPSSKKAKNAGSCTKLPQKISSQWDTSLENLFAPDIVQKKKKCDVVKDKDHKLSSAKGTDVTHVQKVPVPPDTNELQKLHSEKVLPQPLVVNRVTGNDATKPNKTSKVMPPGNTDIKTKEKESFSSKKVSLTTEESVGKHSHKRMKEEIPSSTNMPTWRVRAALIYSSSSDSEIDVVKPSKVSLGTPPAIRITETPKTPRTPDVPSGISVHSRCKKVVSDAQEVQLGIDLGTPPPARPPTPGKATLPVVQISKEKHKHKKKKKKHDKKHSPKKEKVQFDGDKVHSKSDLVAAEGLMQLTSVSSDKHSGELSSKETVSGAKRKHKHSTPSEHSKKRHGLTPSLPVAPSSLVCVPSVSQQPSLPKVQVPVNGLPVTISDDGPVGFYFDESGNRVWVCPSCGGQDDGSPMIRCDDCYAWYHWSCVGIVSAPDENVDWFCSYCFSKNDRQMKKHKSSSVHRKKSHSKSSKK